jgi:hypothetical protein
LRTARPSATSNGRCATASRFRGQREFVESFLTHPDPRVRAYATEVVAVDREQRAAFRRALREDEEALFEVGPPGDIDPHDPIDADDIPF